MLLTSLHAPSTALGKISHHNDSPTVGTTECESTCTDATHKTDTASGRSASVNISARSRQQPPAQLQPAPSLESGVQPRLSLNTVNELIDTRCTKSFQDRRQSHFVCPRKCPSKSSRSKLESSLNQYGFAASAGSAAVTAELTGRSGAPQRTSPQRGKVPTPEQDHGNNETRSVQRRRTGDAKIATKGRPPLLDVNIDCLRPLFHLPQPEAAQKLGVSLTRLRSTCRCLGLKSWPSVGMPAMVSEASDKTILRAESELTEPNLIGCTPTSVFSLPGLLTIGLHMCMGLIILILVPVKIVFAFFSSEPPWCTSLPESDDPSCRRPSGSCRDRQTPNQTRRIH